MVHAPQHFGVWAQVEPGKVEERQRVAVADVEEEVGRTLIVTVLEQLGERESEHTLVELDRPLDIGAQQREVMHATGGGSWAVDLQVASAQPIPLLGSIGFFAMVKQCSSHR